MRVVKVKREALRRLIAEQNVSQREFAARLGVSPACLSMWLAGTRHPSPLLRRRLLAVLGAEFGQVFRFARRSPNVAGAAGASAGEQRAAAGGT